MTGPADRIELRGIRAVGICGALPEERERPQPLEVDLDVHLDLSAAGASDALDDTVDYGDLAQAVVALLEESRVVLLERLAEVVATAVLAHDRVESVRVSLRKLRPPVPVDLATSGVTITRSRTRP